MRTIRSSEQAVTRRFDWNPLNAAVTERPVAQLWRWAELLGRAIALPATVPFPKRLLQTNMKRAQDYHNHLAHLGASRELLNHFDQLVAISEHPITTDKLKSSVIEVCIKHKFLRPFEVDGTPRVLRQVYNDDFDGVGDSVQEVGYRRGYDQGFQAALDLWRKQKTLSEAEEFARRLHSWRIRPFQILGSSPGDDEGEATWLNRFAQPCAHANHPLPAALP